MPTDLAKTGVGLLALLVVAMLLGGLLGGVGDLVFGDALAGTPLGPSSDLSPVLWTLIAGVAIYAVSEVS